MTSRKVCIFHGRFQPFHVGHFAVLDYILNSTEDDVVVGIINPNPRQILSGNGEDWVRFSREKNPLSFWERYHCIDLVIRKANWGGRILGIVPLPRPSVNLEQANCYIPPKPRLFTICCRSSDEIEVWKKEQYRKINENVLEIPISTLPPFCPLISGELIRCLIALNNPKWKELVPSPTVAYMEEEKLDLKIAAGMSRNKAKAEVRNLLKDESSGLTFELFPELYEELLVTSAVSKEHTSSFIYRNLVALQEKMERQRQTEEDDIAIDNIEKAKEYTEQNRGHKAIESLKKVGQSAKEYSIEVWARVITKLIEDSMGKTI